MTTQIELVKIISSLVPHYEGESDKLPCVVDALHAVDAFMTDATRQTGIRVILSKFAGKARHAIGQNPNTVQEIIDALKQKCKSTETPEMIIAKMNSTKQSGEVSKFTESIEKLTAQLENAYIGDDIPAATATKMAVSTGIKSLINGLKQQESKLLLKAGQFPTISSAVQKILENEQSTGQSSQMFVTNRAAKSYDRNGNYNRSSNRGYRGRGRNNYNGYPNNYSNSRNNYNEYPNNYSNNSGWRGRGNSNQRGRGGNRGRYANAYYQQQIAGTNQNAPPVTAPQVQGQNNIHPLGQPFGQHTH